jgi:UDP-2-acetamido-3-amino-2,3-dideoxy-glucuronate N-acetyltransferase
VVTHDVPDYALMMGVPAVHAGWMCYCGVRLPDSTTPTCPACGRQYVVENNHCKMASEHEALTEKVAA